MRSGHPRGYTVGSSTVIEYVCKTSAPWKTDKYCNATELNNLFLRLSCSPEVTADRARQILVDLAEEAAQAALPPAPKQAAPGATPDSTSAAVAGGDSSKKKKKKR